MPVTSVPLVAVPLVALAKADAAPGAATKSSFGDNSNNPPSFVDTTVLPSAGEFKSPIFDNKAKPDATIVADIAAAAIVPNPIVAAVNQPYTEYAAYRIAAPTIPFNTLPTLPNGPMIDDIFSPIAPKVLSSNQTIQLIGSNMSNNASKSGNNTLPIVDAIPVN